MSDPQQYTVGWICAIPTEHTAARQFLDEEHDQPKHISANDSNNYTLGRMSGHNVVIAVLPDGEYGLSSATAVAKDMLNSFPNVRVGLMVGIGGGAPTAKHDIRLGDVVVSSRQGETGGVYQYDYGKTIQGRSFQQTGFLNQPPAVLRTAVSGLKSKYEEYGHQIEASIRAALDKKPRLRQKYTRPRDDTDCLYKSNVVHPHGSEHDCKGVCGSQTANLIQRPRREGDQDNPAIHYGVIASANQLMKDATIRDTIAKEKGVLCFEMEAAGLMNHFPCLVVRGICDYSDSHKNNEWQGYAAMTAAAYSRDLLRIMVSNRVEYEDRIGKVLAEFNFDMKELCRTSKMSTEMLEAHVHSTREHFENEAVRFLSKDYRNCHQAFKTSTYEQFKNINPDRVERTCQWALEHEIYHQWEEAASDALLWISADPGCGKSVLSKSLVDEILPKDPRTTTICYFFFKENEEQNSLATALCAILHQLFESQRHLISHAIHAWEKNGIKIQHETDELWRIFLAATSDAAAGNTVCIFDALDECRDFDRSKLTAKLSQFHRHGIPHSAHHPMLKVLVTSRPYDDIQRDFGGSPLLHPVIRLRGEEENDQIHQEINYVVRSRVAELTEKLHLKPHVAIRLENTLLEMKHRTYLWLYLAIDDIRKTYQGSPWPDEESVQLVPTSVDNAYEKILARVTDDQKAMVKAILQIIVGARRPLSLEEMASALSAARWTDKKTTNPIQIETSRLEYSLRHWCGLFVFVNHSRIYLIHQTAREFLLSDAKISTKSFQRDNTWKHCISQILADSEMAFICESVLHAEANKIMKQPARQSSPLQHSRMYSGEYVNPGHSQSSSNQQTKESAAEGNPLLSYAAVNWSTHIRVYEEPDTNGPSDVPQIMRPGLYFEFWTRIRAEADFGFHNLFLDIQRRPLHVAAYDRLSGLMKKMCADPMYSSENGESAMALLIAARRGHEEVVRELIRRNCTVFARDKLGRTPLFHSAARGYKEIVSMILSASPPGEITKVSDRYYLLPIEVAASNKEEKIALELLNASSWMKQKDYQKLFFIASEKGLRKLVQKLLQDGEVNVDSYREGKNALHLATANNHLEVVKQLVLAGAIVTLRSRPENHSVLHFSAANGDNDLTKYFLEGMADRRSLEPWTNLLDHQEHSPLHKAVDKGHASTVDLLLKHLEDKSEVVAAVNKPTDWPLYPISVAAREGWYEVAEVLLKHGADVNKQNGDLETALFAATSNGFKDIVRLLLSEDADPSIADRYQRTPLDLAKAKGFCDVENILQAATDRRVKASQTSDLHPLQRFLQACKLGDKTAAQKLLESHSSEDEAKWVGYRDDHRNTLLHLAAYSGDRDTVQFLLAKSVPFQPNKFEDTPLDVAVVKGYEAMVSSLLATTADLSYFNPGLMTSLHLAAQCGNTNIAIALLEKTPDEKINALNEWLGSPLHLAAENGHVDIVNLLLKRGADITIRNIWYKTPIDLARENGHLELFMNLCAARAGEALQDPETCSQWRNNDLHKAVKIIDLKAVRTALKQGLREDPGFLERANRRGECALHIAAQAGSRPILKLLLSKSPDVHALAKNGMTALHFACMCKTADMAEILIEHKASVRAQNFWHWTPLHFAVRAKAHATVRVLLNNGADVDATTEGGHTPLHFAAANRDEKLMHILINEGKARQDMVNRSGFTPADEFRQHEVLYTM